LPAIYNPVLPRAGLAEYPYRRASAGITLLSSASEDQQLQAGQPASKRLRTSEEPGTIFDLVYLK
jgi:hypothetical protein